MLVESNMKHQKAIILARQLKFYRRFKNSLRVESTRYDVFNALLADRTDYLKHYQQLDQKYNNIEEIYAEFDNKIKKEIKRLAVDDKHYKYRMYEKINPTLTPSPYIYDNNINSCYTTKFRLGSHRLPIETGRWTRIERNKRL